MEVIRLRRISGIPERNWRCFWKGKPWLKIAKENGYGRKGFTPNICLYGNRT
jgi:hypothetical protein